MASLANVKNLKFLRKQYYLYNVNPNISTAVAQGINFGFSVEKFKIIKNHIKQSFKILGVKDKDGRSWRSSFHLFYN